jgi:hypothetical protein
VNDRLILAAIVYVAITGCAWRQLPARLRSLLADDVTLGGRADRVRREALCCIPG